MIAALAVSVFSVGFGGLPAEAAPPTGTLDVSVAPDSDYTTLAPDRTIMETFTAGATGVLTGVDVYPNGSGDAAITLSVLSVSNGAPTSTVLATGEFAATSAAGWETASLSQVVPVAAGQQYAIEVTSPGTTYIESTGSTYPGTQYYFNGSSFPYVTIAFQTYVDTSRIAPTISGSPASTGVVGTPYSGSYTVTGTPAPTVAYSGTLPPGISLSSSGVLSGSPTTSGTYTFTPTAMNSAASATGPTTTITVRARQAPGAPTGVTATAGNSSATVSWTAPSSTGDDPITSYTVTSSGAQTCTTSTTSCTVSGLTPGTSYTFTVTATSTSTGPSSSASNAVTPYTVPAAPSTAGATAGNSQATVTWSTPSTGGSAITGYTVQESASGGAWQTAASPGMSATSATITGLTNGTSYSFRVAAVNVAGTGDWSPTASATPYTVPDAPASLSATSGDASVALSWQAPSSNGATISGYSLRYRPDVSSTWTTTTIAGTTNTVTGLTNGTLYDFQVAAMNIGGTGAYSATVTSTPATVPTVPTAVTGTAGDQSVAVAWSVPSNNGGASVIGYDIRYAPSGTTDWTTISGVEGTTLTLPSLENGSAYDVEAAAQNSAGLGPWSTAITVTPRTTAAAPTALTATPDDASAALAWTAPTDNGGAAITGWSIEQQIGNGAWTAATSTSTGPTSATIPDLANGTQYAFRVAAVNTAGTGAWSILAEVTPRTVPAAPTDLAATPADSSAALSWTAPANDGGADISRYDVVYRPAGTESWTDAGTVTGTTDTVSGLDNGTAYEFAVGAENAAGTGAQSDPVEVTPRTVPTAPSISSVVPADGAVSISWDAAGDGGAPISGYVVQTSPDGQTWTDAASTSSTDVDPLSATVSGLADGVAVELRVLAVNVAGGGAPSVPVTATPRTTADAPTWVAATPGDGTVELSWAAPANDGGASITGYELQDSTDGTTWQNVPTTGIATETTATGLTNGTAESFRIRADNAAGPGAWSTLAAATPRTTAAAPIDLTATPGDGTVALSWTAPDNDGGSAVAGYEVEYRVAGAGDWSDPVDATDTTTALSALDDGTAYDFRVRAENVAGDGEWSTVASSTPFTFHIDATLPSGSSLSGETVVPGTVVQLSADDLPVGATITVEAHSTSITLGTVEVGQDGTADLTVTIPASLPVGAHTLTATLTGTGADPVVVSVPFTLRAAASIGGLAFTGSNIPSLTGWLVLLAVVLGTLGIVVGRRRRARR
jgi:hypothetical protein